MNAPELLATVEARGVSMRRETDATGAAVLKIRPVSLVSDLLPEIARFKPALLELLESPAESPKTAPNRAQTDAAPNLSPDAKSGPQIEFFAVDGAAEINHLARVILECIRPNGAFDFSLLKPYWRAANDLTGASMTSQELGIWARSILAEKAGENYQ
jgi:hypothetical protein